MIIYFSATGNSKYTAERLQTENETLFSISDWVKQNTSETTQIIVPEGEKLGIISPVYDWGLPSIVKDFLERAEIEFASKPYTYLVITYGTTTGQCGANTAKHGQYKHPKTNV